MTAVEKLVAAGEQVGFSVEQMIQLLQTGSTVETLLRMIELRLFPTSLASKSSHWVM